MADKPPKGEAHTGEAHRTEEEERLIRYHRASLSEGKALHRPNGQGSTVVMGEVVVDGKSYMVPFYDKESGKVMTRAQARERWLPSIKAGKWPVDTSGEAHNERAERLHKQVEADEYILKRPPQSVYDFRKDPLGYYEHTGLIGKRMKKDS